MRALAISIVVLGVLIGSLIAFRGMRERTAGPESTASPGRAPGDRTPSQIGLPSVEAADASSVSSTFATELASPTVSGDRLNSSTSIPGETPAVEGNAASAAKSSAENPDTPPKGGSVAAECWEIRGESPQDYAVTLDRAVRTSGEASAMISSLRNSTGYATVFQTTSAAAVRGKRVEFSADIRTRGAVGSANLLLRAEDARGRTVAFDNMQTYGASGRPDQRQNRGVKGDSDWSTQHIVLDIPADAAVITYGISMFNGGKAWIDNARIEVVSNDMPTTAVDFRPSTPRVMPFPPESLTRSPKNLEFDLEAKYGAQPCN